MDKYITPLTNRVAPAGASLPAKVNYSVSFTDRLKEYSEKVAPQQKQASPSKAVLLVGEISSCCRTVSELLMQHSDLRKSTWDILGAEQNRDKDYTKLPPGTRVYYNSEDGTLSWPDTAQPRAASASIPLPASRAIGLPVAMVQEDGPASRPAAGMRSIGVIGDKAPTVSHLLQAHPELHNDTWDILSSAANRGKDFTTIPVGTAVQIDPVTREISWQSSGQGPAVAVARVETGPVGGAAASGDLATSAAAAPPPPAGEEQPVLLGRIDRSNPTVSHLLTRHPELGERAWTLLSSSVNRDKPFQEIPGGTAIYLQPGSNEISWTATDGRDTIPEKDAAAPPALQHKSVTHTIPATDLTEAVQPFLGTSYKEMNCYELLVKGLERMDIPYVGKDGLLNRLTGMAREKGLPANAFLNGEGIVKAAGALVLARKFPRTSDWKEEAEHLFREMEPLLDKGQILSFSTRNRGHTGIVSQQDSQWTFINSGRLDNSLTSNSPSRGVGEEILKKEIGNWFKLASARGESLTVTLGALAQEKVVTAFNMPEAATGTSRI